MHISDWRIVSMQCPRFLVRKIARHVFQKVRTGMSALSFHQFARHIDEVEVRVKAPVEAALSISSVDA